MQFNGNAACQESVLPTVGAYFIVSSQIELNWMTILFGNCDANADIGQTSFLSMSSFVFFFL